jgi:hypothetical protein
MIPQPSNQGKDYMKEIINEAILNKAYSKNLVGLTTDGAHNLRGKHNSALSRLK